MTDTRASEIAALDEAIAVELRTIEARTADMNALADMIAKAEHVLGVLERVREGAVGRAKGEVDRVAWRLVEDGTTYD